MTFSTSTLAHDAHRVSLLFQYGVLTSDDVISWADSAIVQMDKPPYSLIELSTTPADKVEDIISHLRQLSSGSDLWNALRSAIPQIQDFLVAHPDRAESIANHFSRAAYYFGNVPKDLNFMFRFDDVFSLAREGIYGKPKTAYSDFMRELEKVTPPT